MSAARRDKKAPRVRCNGAITAAQVRLIDENGNQVGVVDRTTALQAARDAGLDLVEIAGGATPPVCRVMAESKWRYEQQQKERTRRAVRHEIKELKVGVRIAEGDLATKCRSASRWLAQGDRVKVVVQMRGREQSRPEAAHLMLQRVVEATGAKIEQQGKVQGRNLIALLAPSDKAPAAAQGTTAAS